MSAEEKTLCAEEFLQPHSASVVTLAKAAKGGAGAGKVAWQYRGGGENTKYPENKKFKGDSNRRTMRESVAMGLPAGITLKHRMEADEKNCHEHNNRHKRCTANPCKFKHECQIYLKTKLPWYEREPCKAAVAKP